eukprot:m.419123 g.419123  ORF g.419123 m.419123 type:complete len:543 (+) comp21300_c0_seq2:196-1824(+)
MNYQYQNQRRHNLRAELTSSDKHHKRKTVLSIDGVNLSTFLWFFIAIYTILESLFVFFWYTLFGYRLPPRPSAFKILKWTQKYGMFNNHRMTAASFDWTGSKIVTIVVPGMPLAVIINDVNLVEEVMTNKSLYNSRGWTGFNVWVPQGLLALPTGDQWALHRRLITKFLSTNYLRDYATIVVKKTKNLLQTWREEASDNGEPQDVQEYLAMCTLDIISVVAFGCELAVEGQGKQLKQAVNVVLEETALRTREGPLRTLLSWRRRQRFQESLQWLRDAIIDASLRNPEAHLMKKDVKDSKQGNSSQHEYADNILGLLRKTQAEGVDALTEDEIVQEVMTIAGAGHETTANTLSWALLLLAEYPRVQRKLQAHVDAGVKGEVATFEEAHQLDYCLSVIYETLRLFPTVPLFPRECARTCQLAGFDIPKHAKVVVTQTSINRNPDIFPDPEVFRPERFEGADMPKPSLPVGVVGGPDFGFIPFGAGQRTCVGQRLAVLEAIQILSGIMKSFTVELANVTSATVGQNASITLRPVDLRLKLTKRRT